MTQLDADKQLQIVRTEPPEPPMFPEPNVSVRVLPPFSVAYDGVPYWGGATVEVPKSLADKWIRNQWAEVVE